MTRGLVRSAKNEDSMPHCVFEYSSNVIDEPDWSRTLLALHKAIMGTGLFVLSDIKSRVIKHEQYLVGDGRDNQAFVTLDVQILAGRTNEVKSQISQAALPILAAAFPKTSADMKCSITVQVSDIHQPSYRRQINYPI
jgi:5-carboxymethyl-2-hydroxymuconate isomerase